MSRIKRLLFFLLVLQTGLLVAQNESLIKEIKGKIAKADDAELFDLLNDLAWEYRFAYPDSTIYFCSQAFELGENLLLKKGLSRPLNYMGVAYDKKGEPINAYDKYTQAFKLAEQQQDSNQIAYSHNNIGRLLSEQGIHAKALDYFIKAKRLFENLKDSSGLAYVHQSIGRIHSAQRDFRKARESFREAYDLRVKLGNTRDIMAALVLLGDLSQESGEVNQSLHYFLKADSAGRVINDRINLAEIQIFLAKNYLAKGQLDSAQILSAEGLQVIASQNAMRTLPEALLVRGQVMAAMKKNTEARNFYVKALELAERTKELEVKLRGHYLLWKLSEQLGNKSEGILHYNQYLVIQDSLKDLEVTRNLERLQFEIEIQKRDLENQLARARDEATIQAARWQNIILSIVTVFTVIMIFVLWRNNKKKQEINQKLVIQNHRLEELNHEKDTLMNIVAHDLKSPLNRINGLVHLVEIDRAPESLHKYVEIIKKTTQSGLTLIADLLDLNAVSETSLRPHIKHVEVHNLVDEKIETYREAAQAKNITIVKLNPDILLVPTDPDFIKRILDNLLSNAIKFSHPNSRVSINYGEGEREFFFSVKDNGPGFSDKDKSQLYQKFRRLSAQPTASESSNGLGLALIKNLVDRLGGKIILNSVDRKGSEFIVTIPFARILVAQP
jgi:signal transduction histidine kinase